MTTAQVVETLVTVNNISPMQDYVHPDNQTQPTFEMTPIGSNPFTNLKQFSVLYLGPKIWNSLQLSIRIYLKLYHKFLILNYL